MNSDNQPIPAFQMTGKVVSTLVAPNFGDHKSVQQKKLSVIINHGVLYDSHVRPRVIDSRETILIRHGFQEGTGMFNVREWSAVSREELAIVSREMEAEIPEGFLGENLIISGIENFSLLPAGTKLFFQAPDEKMRTAVLLVMEENGPCKIPGHAIVEANPEKPDLKPTDFIKHAKHRRGILGIVLVTGIIKPGDNIIVEVPEQRPYLPS